MNKKFEYFLNAIHYCLYLEEKWSTRLIEKCVLRLFHGLSILFNFEGFYQRKMEERLKNKDLQEFMYGKKWGESIGFANHWFGYFYSGYPALLSFILTGFYFRLCEEINYLIVLVIASIPIGICYIPAYKAVFTKDRYLKYFKQFKKEDEQWHRKWKRITITFCIGSILMTLLGILAIWGVLLY
jgi:hypothetical protein